ncbi:MAG: hypothetical protein ACI4QJ_00115 [Candidatus Spyradenecus sp.]
MKKEVLICAGMTAGLLAMTGCQSAAEWTARTVSGYATLEERLQSENEFVRQYAEVEQVRLACTPGTQKSAEEQLAIVEALATQGSIDLVAKNAIDDCTIPEAMRVAAIKRVIHEEVLEKIYQQADATPAVRAAVISSSECPKELWHKAVLELPGEEPATKIALERLMALKAKEEKSVCKDDKYVLDCAVRGKFVEELFLARTDPAFRKLLVQMAGEAVQGLCSWEVAPYWQEITDEVTLVHLLREVAEADNEDAKKLGIKLEASVTQEDILAKLAAQNAKLAFDIVLGEKLALTRNEWHEYEFKKIEEAKENVKRWEAAVAAAQLDVKKAKPEYLNACKNIAYSCECSLKEAKQNVEICIRDVQKMYDTRPLVITDEIKKACGKHIKKEDCAAFLKAWAKDWGPRNGDSSSIEALKKPVEKYVSAELFDEVYPEMYKDLVSWAGKEVEKRLSCTHYLKDVAFRHQEQTRFVKEMIASMPVSLQEDNGFSFPLRALVVDDDAIDSKANAIGEADLEVLVKVLSEWTLMEDHENWSSDIKKSHRREACVLLASKLWERVSEKLKQEHADAKRISEVATKLCITTVKPRFYQGPFVKVYLESITEVEDIRRLVKEVPGVLKDVLEATEDPALRQELQAQYDAQCKAAVELAEANGAALQKLMSNNELTPNQRAIFRNVYGDKLLIFHDAKIRQRNVEVKQEGLLRMRLDALGKEAGLFTDRLVFYADMYGESRKKGWQAKDGQLCTVITWVSYAQPNYEAPERDGSLDLMALQLDSATVLMGANDLHNTKKKFAKDVANMHPDVFQGWSCIVPEGEDPVAVLQQLIKDVGCEGSTIGRWAKQKISPTKTFAEKVGFAYDE